MNIDIENQIAINKLVIKARWLYIIGIIGAGVINRFFGLKTSEIPYFSVFLLFVVAFVINYLLFIFINQTEKKYSSIEIQLLTYLQIIFELTIFTMIIHLTGGIESAVLVFLVFPIISGALLLGYIGSIMIAVISSLIVVILVLFEFVNIIPHINVYGRAGAEYTIFSLSIVKMIIISVFFIIISFLVGYGARLLRQSKKLISQNSYKLDKEESYRKNEWQQLDKTTKLLVKRDLELTKTNKELDKKIKDLERSEISMLKAFADLKKERKELDKERNKTSAIISNFIDPIILIDTNNKIVLFNPVARSVFGFIDSDIGKKIDPKNSYSLENFKNIIKREFTVLRGSKINTKDPMLEEVNIKYVGQELTYKVITAAVRDEDNENLGIVKIFYNLTREKMIDKLKSEFISIAAHQLRTPLSAIKWVIKMVLDGDVGELNDEQKEFLSKGYKSNERIIQLVNDMLNVSRIEEGRFGYKFNRDSFEELLETEIDNLRQLIDKKKIKLKVEKSGKIPKVNMDKSKMSLVMQNLLENAVKYTPENGKITISLESSDKLLKVKVKDNGVGVPKKDQAKLFSKFFRAENVMRMQTEGSGLGLFIVRNIIKKHGGEITCNSEEGLGTEFIFTLPLNNK